MAPNGQRPLQIRQPEQCSESIDATTGSIVTIPLLIIPWTRAAAAAPRATPSGMSLGPWPGAAQKYPIGRGAPRVEFGRALDVPAGGPAGDARLQAGLAGIVTGL